MTASTSFNIRKNEPELDLQWRPALKPKVFLDFAKKNKLGFIALEYSGHGKSTGKFTKGNISKWSKEAYLLIKKILKENNIYYENIGYTQKNYFEIEDEFRINNKDLFKINNKWYNNF